MSEDIRNLLCVGGNNDGVTVNMNADRRHVIMPIEAILAYVTIPATERAIAYPEIQTEVYRVAYFAAERSRLAMLVHSSLSDLQAMEMLIDGYRKPRQGVLGSCTGGRHNP